MAPPSMTATEQLYLEAARSGDAAETDRLCALVDAEQAAREAELATDAALLDAALWYATALDLPVFPCRPGGKQPATEHGFKDATTDTGQIRAWWKVRHDYNIGIPTGVKFDVFDIDGPDGLVAFGPYITSDTFPPVLGSTLTPRGRHYLVPVADQGNRTALMTSVDYRGTGGYIVAPPSRTSVGTYRWVNPPAVEPVAVAA